VDTVGAAVAERSVAGDRAGRGRGDRRPRDPLTQYRIAVLVPCYNEETAIAQVIADFRAALPQAAIYVYDNNSRDRTAEIARVSGAIVRGEQHQGKGHVVRRMFSDIEADVYVLVDGDATYDAPSGRAMIARLFADRLDMVVGARVDRDEATYRLGHRFGNRLLTAFVANVFGDTFRDILSGYRVFSRRFVKSFPALSGGFEIETELTAHALVLELPVAEVETPYFARPAGSLSKLNTWRDGVRILGTIVKLYRSERPLGFFSAIGISLGIMSVGIAIPIFVTYLEDGLVPRLPTAVLSTGLMVVAALAIACGLVLDTVTRGRREVKRLAYLSHRPPATISSAAKPGDRLAAGWGRGELGEAVKEILRTNDQVLVSAVVALLDGAGIPHFVADQNMSVLEGSIGILPRRVLVAEDYSRSARRLLEEAGLGGELRPDAG
jgi:glycosyltransferase involved in cell wall biosynthesis